MLFVVGSPFIRTFGRHIQAKEKDKMETAKRIFLRIQIDGGKSTRGWSSGSRKPLN